VTAADRSALGSSGDPGEPGATGGPAPGAGVIPLRLPHRVFWFGAIALGLVGILAVAGSPPWHYVDFPHFWSAGRTVGTPDLVDPVLRQRWGEQYGMYLSPWVYPAGAAWLFVPFGIWSLDAGFWLHAATMTGLVAASGLLGARLYGLDTKIGLVMAFAWTPCMASAVYGQNAPLGLFLSLLAVEGLRRDNDALAGLGAGLLLYKPTLALPVLGLLVLRLRWRALLVVAAVTVAWYLVGVPAAAGDWGWPAAWLSNLNSWYAQDTAHNTIRAVSLTGLLEGLGTPTLVSTSVGLAIVVLALPRLIGAPIVEAGAGALLVGLVVSPHALNWEGALMLPALLWALGGSGTGLREPARTWLVAGACLVATEHLVSETLGFSVLVWIASVGALVWIAGWWRMSVQAAAPAAPAAQYWARMTGSR
jgi:hypothetical protein